MGNALDRREFLEKGTAGMLAAAAVATARSGACGEDSPLKPVRIGVVGVGGRGRWHVTNMLTYQENVVIPAICDYRTDRLAMAIETVKKAKGYEPDGYPNGKYDYRNMLERDDLDGILVATGIDFLGRISIDSLAAGKPVGHEVPGCYTLEECWELVEEHERSGKHCMLLENCCYGDETLMILNMIRQGLFGEPYFGVGSYVHDCRYSFFEADGTITWRGELWRDAYGCNYNSHALGSPSKWLGINDGDRFEYCLSMQSRPAGAHAYWTEKLGPQSEAAKVDFKTGDFVSTLIHTAQGRQIRVDYSLACTRPYSRYYLLQGMNGCFDSRTGMYLHGTSADYNWDPVDKFKEQYQHDYWRTDGAMAKKAGGHGGIDYFCIHDFIKMVRTGEPPWIDAYDAASWSSILHFSKLSLDRKGGAVEIDDFTRGKWKDPNWRQGRMA